MSVINLYIYLKFLCAIFTCPHSDVHWKDIDLNIYDLWLVWKN